MKKSYYKQDDSIKTIHYLKHRPSENLIMPNGWDTKILDVFKLYKNFNIKINNTIIGKNYPTYIIAELSCNHNQDKKVAQLIDAAYKAGANAIKLQTYTDTITIKSNKIIY